MGVFGGSLLVYSISRPGQNGEQSTMHRWFEKLANYGTEWETKNHLMTAALEQAAHDRHLLYGVERSKNFELTYPEYVIDFLTCPIAGGVGEGQILSGCGRACWNWGGLGALLGLGRAVFGGHLISARPTHPTEHCQPGTNPPAAPHPWNDLNGQTQSAHAPRRT
jgi:hypothetical protein